MLARSLGTSRARVSLRRLLPIPVLVIFQLLTLGAGASLSPWVGRCSASDPEPLTRYGSATWGSIKAMESPIGLPADGLDLKDGRWIPRPYTSPSDIGAHLWSIVAADSLGEVSAKEAAAKAALVIKTLRGMKTDNGLFFSWYDPATGEPVKQWPGTTPLLTPFISSVDNAWLEVGIRVAGARYPALEDECKKLTDKMCFRRFLSRPGDPKGTVAEKVVEQGVFHVGYFPDSGNLTTARYSMLNSETRIIYYLALMKGEVQAEQYSRLWRTVPLDAGPQKMRPEPVCPNGCARCPGAYVYDGRRFVPSWGGSMFEALLVPLFVPEESWSPKGWGENHRRYVRAQQHYGLSKLNCGFWGFSPCMDPAGGYLEFGVSDLGASPTGYSSGRSGPVITPHASFLALRFDRDAAVQNLRRLEKSFPCFTEQGFLDAVNVKTGELAKCVLVLDQGMILAAIANERSDGVLRGCFSTHDRRGTLKAVLSAESFCFENTSAPPPISR